jgi:hypothetical protein
MIMSRTLGPTVRRDGTTLARLLNRPRGSVVQVRAREETP